MAKRRVRLEEWKKEELRAGRERLDREIAIDGCPVRG